MLVSSTGHCSIPSNVDCIVEEVDERFKESLMIQSRTVAGFDSGAEQTRSNWSPKKYSNVEPEKVRLIVLVGLVGGARDIFGPSPG